MRLPKFDSRALLVFALFLPASILLPSFAEGRSVYLNGKDISSARDQDLHNVEVRIDGTGNIFLDAPHYEVSEEARYTPLSSYVAPATEAVRSAPVSNGLKKDAKTLERQAAAAKLPVQSVEFGREPPTPSELNVPSAKIEEQLAPGKLIPKGGNPGPK